MIRVATKYDTDTILDMLRNYRNATPIEELKEANDAEYVKSILNHIFAGLGVVLLAETDKPVGMLIAMIMPNFWHQSMSEMQELAYWVEPEHRGGTAGYRLLKAYVDYAEDLKQNNRIKHYSISKMVNSPDIKYDRFGFRKLEERWVN